MAIEKSEIRGTERKRQEARLMGRSHLETKFALNWDSLYPDVDLHTEYRFHPTRRFRIDFAHLPSKTGIEVQGATWSKGAHSSGSGLQRDFEKQLLAASMGWVILPISGADVEKDEVYGLIKQTIEIRCKYAGVNFTHNTSRNFKTG